MNPDPASGTRPARSEPAQTLTASTAGDKMTATGAVLSVTLTFPTRGAMLAKPSTVTREAGPSGYVCEVSASVVF